MKLTGPTVTGKQLLIALLAVSLIYPSICAKSAIAVTTTKTQKTISSRSRIKATSSKIRGNNKLAPLTPKKFKDKRAAMMYFLWFALKHNRPS